MSPDGWRLHVVGADGTNDRTLTDWLPVVQQDPPVPGPKAKRYWLDGGRLLGFTQAGTDYGAAEEAGAVNKPAAGNDIENLWSAPTDGSSDPKRLTDLTRIYYLLDVSESPQGDAIAFDAFSYLSRSQQLWSVAKSGGKPVLIDGPVRWFMWVD